MKLNKKQIKDIEKYIGLPCVSDKYNGCDSFSNQHLSTGSGTWPHRIKGHKYINIWEDGKVDTFGLTIGELIYLSDILDEAEISQVNQEIVKKWAEKMSKGSTAHKNKNGVWVDRRAV